MATQTNNLRLRLLQLGALLFLLGLISGLLTGAVTNPRMGLSAHMQGITNGVFLLAIGAIWPLVQLSALWQRVAVIAFAVGTVLNWASVQLAALWGASRMMPIAGAGFEALSWQETVVSLGLLVVTVAMLLGSTLLLIGLLRSPPAATGDAVHP